jgi:ferric-dicitrate binding protein FerR (iron transport regulator)
VKGKVLLPDGSEVWLNSHSVLHCPNLFDSINRIVKLDGEGYFKIKEMQDWPFYIQTQKGVTIRVTGTEFNLSSYANDPFLKMTLISGSLMLIDDASMQTISLKPMEEFVLQNNQFKRAVQNTAKRVKEDTSWKEGYLIFDNTPIDAVIRKIERWYGVTIDINDSHILNFRITAEFESESLIQVLEILQISSNIRYRVNGNRAVLYL